MKYPKMEFKFHFFYLYFSVLNYKLNSYLKNHGDYDYDDHDDAYVDNVENL